MAARPRMRQDVHGRGCRPPLTLVTDQHLYPSYGVRRCFVRPPSCERGIRAHVHLNWLQRHARPTSNSFMSCFSPGFQFVLLRAACRRHLSLGRSFSALALCTRDQCQATRSPPRVPSIRVVPCLIDTPRYGLRTFGLQEGPCLQSSSCP
mmetsp:Transcript_1068/g.2001  ORF Transcript_1068/g.2001 Transcript_1068/m.2001 type:complete len:150 (-) Transcript_1068:450-899(-)|eukprot:scaffold139373_cov28-Tisochrysis_lutea.AAC.3